MTAHYYNQAARRNQEVVLTYKNKDIANGAGVIDLERSRMPDISPGALAHGHLDCQQFLELLPKVGILFHRTPYS